MKKIVLIILVFFSTLVNAQFAHDTKVELKNVDQLPIALSTTKILVTNPTTGEIQYVPFSTIQSSSPVVGANNGLIVTNNNVQLGGAIINNTAIGLGTNSLVFNSLGAANYISMNGNTGLNIFHGSTQTHTGSVTNLNSTSTNVGGNLFLKETDLAVSTDTILAKKPNGEIVRTSATVQQLSDAISNNDLSNWSNVTGDRTSNTLNVQLGAYAGGNGTYIEINDDEETITLNSESEIISNGQFNAENGFQFKSSASQTNSINFNTSSLTEDRDVFWRDEGGIVAFTSDLDSKLNLTGGTITGVLNTNLGINVSSTSGSDGLVVRRNANTFSRLTHSATEAINFYGNHNLSYRFDGTSRFTFTPAGRFTASSVAITGGTGNNLLLDNGTTTPNLTAGTGIAINNGVISATGGGGSLPANFYEEGTFTPTLTAGTGGSYTITSSFGSYVRTGDIVYLQIVISGINSTSPTGNISISGFPRASSGLNSLNIQELSGSNISNVLDAVTNTSGTDIRLSSKTLGTSLTDVSFTTGRIVITGTYRTNVYTP